MSISTSVFELKKMDFTIYEKVECGPRANELLASSS